MTRASAPRPKPSSKRKTKPPVRPPKRKPLPPATRIGKPGVLDEQMVDDIVRMLKHGAYIVHAAGAIGVHRRTLYAWLRRGQADSEEGLDTIEARLWVRGAQARARARTAAIEVITAAGKRDWKALAWFLERTEPDLFSERNGDIARRADAAGDAPPPKDEQAAAPKITGTELDDDALEVLSVGELEYLEKMERRRIDILDRARRRRGSLG